MDSNIQQNTIGILYPGEMGSTFGKLLADGGFQVVTTLQGRSDRTRRLCHNAGLRVLDCIRDVIQRSDILISLVTPGAAVDVARNVAALVESPARRLTYIDANSVSAATAVEISQILQVASVDFVDACILSLASRLRERGTLYLSGFRAGELSDLFGQLMRVKIAGDMPGQASAFKMIISGMPKGLVCLFVETMVFAREMGLLNEALETYNEIYPGVMEVIKRMLPTYPQHAARRGEELREVEQTMLLNGLTPCVLRAVREVTVNLAGVGWTKGLEPQQWTVAELIEEAYRETGHGSSGKDARDTVRFSI